MSKLEDNQPGLKEFKALLINRERIFRLYQSEEFQLLLLPYLRAELSNRTDELVFDKHDDYARGVIQGKAQTLHAIINLPQELQELKSIEELQEQRARKAQEDEDAEMV